LSGNFRDNEILITGGDGNSFIAGYAGRFAKISTRGSSTSVGRKGVSSCNDTNSVATSDSGSTITSSFTMTEGSESI